MIDQLKNLLGTRLTSGVLVQWVIMIHLLLSMD